MASTSRRATSADLACPESGADVPFSLKAIVFDGALGHAAGGDTIRDVCAEEPMESVGHGRRLPCVVFTLQRVGLARADAHQLVSRAPADRRQRDATDPAQDRLPLPTAHPVPDDEVPGSATGHLKAQAGHLRVPDRARLPVGLRVPNHLLREHVRPPVGLSVGRSVSPTCHHFAMIRRQHDSCKRIENNR